MLSPMFVVKLKSIMILEANLAKFIDGIKLKTIYVEKIKFQI
jgi:hypothetical protein